MEHYLALFEPDLKAGGYVVTLPDFRYGVTQGETDEEAMEMAEGLLMLTIGDYIREGRPLPAPARRRAAKFRPVSLPALQSAKVDLYTAFLKSGLKKAEFARRIGIPKMHIERLFSLRHHSRLNQIEAALAALGRRLHVEVRDAAARIPAALTGRREAAARIIAGGAARRMGGPQPPESEPPMGARPGRGAER